MSRNDTLFSKENWQTYVLHARPSNASPSISSMPAKTRGPQPRRDKQMWTCSVCKKALSSKRSFTEHMNIHNKTKPFRCDNCSYAAASQMTLHRHKLRNHTPKAEWGYRCPYCEDAYMEPAGYQLHVQQRHPSKSATYGCPFRICNFSSKSQRHFRDHLVKHDRNDKIEGGVDPCSLSNQQLTRYMIKDEIGDGFTCIAPGAAHQKLVIRARPTVGIAPKLEHFHRQIELREPRRDDDVVFEPEEQEHVMMEPRAHKIVYVDNNRHELSTRHTVHSRMIVEESSHVVPSSSSASASASLRYYLPPSSPRRFRAEPLPQTYDQIPREFEIEADPEDFDEMQMDEAEMAEMEDHELAEHRQLDEEDDEEEHYHDDDDDDDDDGPPVLDPQTHLVYAPDPHWIQHEIEIGTNEVDIFPNGFIDDELD